MIDYLLPAIQTLFWISLFFGGLSLAWHRRAWLKMLRRSWAAGRVNLVYYFVDNWLILPIMGLVTAALSSGVTTRELFLFGQGWTGELPTWAVFLLALAVADLVGYWRHRILHWAPLWPIHAIHHCDPAVSYLTLFRFHPLNRLITTVSTLIVLLALGIPIWAIAVTNLVRTAYGYVVHADLPWTFGPIFGRLIVSPVLHRWHHVREGAGVDTNFAAIFAVWDVLFGTYYCPHRNLPPLGVADAALSEGWLGQQLYPFAVWWRILRKQSAVARAS